MEHSSTVPPARHCASPRDRNAAPRDTRRARQRSRRRAVFFLPTHHPPYAGRISAHLITSVHHKHLSSGEGPRLVAQPRSRYHSGSSHAHSRMRRERIAPHAASLRSGGPSVPSQPGHQPLAQFSSGEGSSPRFASELGARASRITCTPYVKSNNIIALDTWQTAWARELKPSPSRSFSLVLSCMDVNAGPLVLSVAGLGGVSASAK